MKKKLKFRKESITDFYFFYFRGKCYIQCYIQYDWKILCFGKNVNQNYTSRRPYEYHAAMQEKRNKVKICKSENKLSCIVRNVI